MCVSLSLCLFLFVEKKKKKAVIAVITLQERWRVATRAFNRDKRSCHGPGNGIAKVVSSSLYRPRFICIKVRATYNHRSYQLASHNFFRLLPPFSSLLATLSIRYVDHVSDKFSPLYGICPHSANRGDNTLVHVSNLLFKWWGFCRGDTKRLDTKSTIIYRLDYRQYS